MMQRMVLLLRQLVLIALVLFSSLPLTSCVEDTPVKIGFVAGITGRVSDLGVASRDAVTLAVEEQNLAGGISGRQLELVIRDDQQDPQAVLQAIRELSDEQVVAILGPLTSSMAVVALPIINSEQILTISPTVKTDQLSGQDDFFLRVTPPVSKNAKQLTRHVTKTLGLTRFAVVADFSNRAFTEIWLNEFKKSFESNGGQIVLVEKFESRPEAHFLPIAERVLLAKPDGVLFLSNAIDTALLSQQIRKLESSVPLYLISFGGRAVNGMSSYHSFYANSQEPRYLAFKERFVQRFGYAPSFVTVLSYDAAKYLFAGLAKRTSTLSLKNALLEMHSFQGLQSEMTLDQYGDVERKLFLTVIKDGQFQVVD